MTNSALPGPMIVVVGGFAGSGKSEMSRRLSEELGVPRLGSDTIGRFLKGHELMGKLKDQAYYLAYDLLFHLAGDFVSRKNSVILDVTLGWDFHWSRLDEILESHPNTALVPFILRCPFEICLQRIAERYRNSPEYYDAPEVFKTDPKIMQVREYLEKLDDSKGIFIDANRDRDQVFEELLLKLREVGSAISP